MHTVGGMLKRILIIACGAACGIILATAVTRVRPAWSLWPNRDLDRNTAYFRSVLDLVGKNYVEEKDAGYDRLTRAALEGMLQSLDPHSEFLKADAYRELSEEIERQVRRHRHPGGAARRQGARDRPHRRHARASAPASSAATRSSRSTGSPSRSSAWTRSSTGCAASRGPRCSVMFFRPSKLQTIELTLTREVIKVESVRDAHVLGGRHRLHPAHAVHRAHGRRVQGRR